MIPAILVPALGQIIETVGNLADSFITTDKEKATLELQNRELDLKEKALDNALASKQIDNNIEDSKSASLFKSGWRPSIGWVCSIALGLTYIPKAFVMTSIWTYQCIMILEGWKSGSPIPLLPLFPDLGVTDLIGLLGTLLGMSTLRTYERVKDKAAS